MISELRTTTALVKAILIDKPDTRNSDNLLYSEVLERIGQAEGVNIGRMAICDVLRNMKHLQLPTIETVGRCRRKIQEKHPELRAAVEVAAIRSEREGVFKEYAKVETL